MNYPLWSLPAKGLLVALVAVVHVFVSHFAVGGGLFLVRLERRARRDHDEALLGYVRTHSRFFALLTLVTGAVTGVGVWLTVGVVHPQATATLVGAFVWVWAIEWTFFATEIVAALVYTYGWDRLDARTHLLVGRIYFASAWLSLAAINAMLSFMLTPSTWLGTGSPLAGFLNPTYLPSLIARTAASFGLAGVYALLTAARVADADLKAKVAGYAGRWIRWMALVLPLGVALFLGAAFAAGVPLGEPLGGSGGGPGGVAGALLGGSSSGNPVTIRAARVVLLASLATFVFASIATTIRRRRYGLPLTGATMACAFLALGAGEWIREDLRKPYVIGSYMLLTGARVTPVAAWKDRPESVGDPFGADALRASGVLAATPWKRLPAAAGHAGTSDATGSEVFRLLCSSCHTIDGYLAVRPLVAKRSEAQLEDTLRYLDTWRGRRMPPFTGSEAERRALAHFLAALSVRGDAYPVTTASMASPLADATTDAAAPAPSAAAVVPRPEPLPLPAPPWLLRALLVAAFVPHLLALNLVVGGSIIALVSRLRARRSPYARVLAAALARSLPVLIAAAMLFGVASFLFLQALHGRVFFTSAVLLAVPWLAIVPALMAGYYASYAAARPGATSAFAPGWLPLAICAAALVLVAFVFANVMGLAERPAVFLSRFLASGSGLHLDLDDPSLAPRFLHVLLGSLAVSGLGVALGGSSLRRRDAAAGAWMIGHGAVWCGVCTVLNVLPGFWWLAVLPREVLLGFMGQDPVGTACFALAILLALGALGLVVGAVSAPRPRLLAAGAASCLGLAVLLMAIVRDVARTAILGRAGVEPVRFVVPQWGAIAAFAGLLAVALALAWWMVTRLRGASGAAQ